MSNRFVLNETSYHGAGAIQNIPEEIKGRGFQKVFLASDPDLIDCYIFRGNAAWKKYEFLLRQAKMR